MRVPQFALEQGETLLLLGSSGSGKSTLLSLICGIVAPQAGHVALMGQDLARLRPAARDRLRAERIGIIFQMFNLLPYASGLDNILLPLRFAPARRARCPDPRAEALRLAGALGISKDLMTATPASRLSVGQQQRVAVARALIGSPPLIVADEPSSSLDRDAQAGFLDLLFTQIRAAGATLLMVSHDRSLAPRFGRAVDLSDIARTERGQPT
ncbi:MAG: ABC transporter ATP-binding protein [Pseudodonghicola sp.]